MRAAFDRRSLRRGGGAEARVRRVKISPTNYVEEQPKASQVSWTLAVLAPRTWSRARHANPQGPQPCRSIQWPWGFPWNEAQSKTKVEEDNDAVRFAFKVVRETLQSNSTMAVTVCAPEQLGSTPRGTLASIWSLPEIRKWARRHRLWRITFYQCEQGSSARAMPTAMLVNHRVSLNRAKRGWPKRACAETAHHCSGLLARRCTCETRRQHIKLARPGPTAPLLTVCTIRWLFREAYRDRLPHRTEERPLPNEAMSAALHGSDAQESDSNETWHSDSTAQDSFKPHCEADQQLLANLRIADQVTFCSFSC